VLREVLKPGAEVAVVSAYVTIYAYDALREVLDNVGEPRLIRALDPQRSEKKAFQLEDEGLSLKSRLEQNRVAKACAQWITEKVSIRSIRQAALLHGKMDYAEAPGGMASANVGSSNFVEGAKT
jgi:hypothetical protein